MSLIFKVCVLMLLYIVSIDSKYINQEKLELVHVIFRHGDRTPDSSYPLDPNANEQYYPFGRGQLTNKGRKREFILGRTLRKEYDDFLGNIVNPDMVEVRTTDYNRTKMSALLCTAGLFPPTGPNIWDDDLPWQPIPYNYEEKNSDHLMGVPFVTCPKYIEMYNEFVQTVPKHIEDFFKFLSKKTGSNVTTPLDAFLISDAIKTQKSLGLKQPDWVTPKLLAFLPKFDNYAFWTFTGNEDLRRIAGGPLLKKIIQDSRDKFEKRLVPPARKLFLYSGHDFTVSAVLAAMDIVIDKPTYGSHVIIEVYKMGDDPYVKVLYRENLEEDPRHLIVPGCSKTCSLDKFSSLLTDVLPEKDLCNE